MTVKIATGNESSPGGLNNKIGVNSATESTVTIINTTAAVGVIQGTSTFNKYDHLEIPKIFAESFQLGEALPNALRKRISETGKKRIASESATGLRPLKN